MEIDKEGLFLRKRFIFPACAFVIMMQSEWGVAAVVIYVEYALVENFCVDVALLWLALLASRQRVCAWRLCLAGVVGALFALGYPLLSLPAPLAYAWKCSMGILLCLIAQKRQKGGGRGALTVLLFYAFTFCFAGGVMAVFEVFSLEYAPAEGGGIVTQVPIGALLLALVAFVVLAKIAISALYKKKRAHACVYECEVLAGGKSLRLDGFADTGNTAVYCSAPVCFLSAERFYDLYGMKPPDAWMEIVTMAGETRVPLYRADGLSVQTGAQTKKTGAVYLSPSKQMRGRAYSLLFPATVIEEKE